jgi:ABC-type transport system involved in multi-copper enzyme maturation permease subunit
MLPVFEITRQTFLLQMRSKLYWVLMTLSVAFGGLFWFVPPDRALPRIAADELFHSVAYISGFTLVLPFIVLYLAVQAIHGDLEDRTSVYLFTRPIRRSWVLLGKWLAVLGLGCLFAWVSISVLYLVVACSGREWESGSLPGVNSYWVYLMAAGLAVAGYGAMGMLLGAYFRRPMLLSMFYIVLQEFASRMPFEAGVHSATVADPVRRFLLTNLEDPGRELRAMLHGRMGNDHGGVVAEVFGDPVMSLSKLIVVTLALALWVYTRREYDARPAE